MINRFKNEYHWLSNFYNCSVEINGLKYPSVEHAYQSEKSNDLEWKLYCQFTKSAGLVKIKSKELITIDCWHDIKLLVMEYLLRQKYYKEPFKTLLLNTGNEYIEEGNYHNDEFWGVNLRTGEGFNNLGLLIMKIREEIKK